MRRLLDPKPGQSKAAPNRPEDHPLRGFGWVLLGHTKDHMLGIYRECIIPASGEIRRYVPIYNAHSSVAVATITVISREVSIEFTRASARLVPLLTERFRV